VGLLLETIDSVNPNIHQPAYSGLSFDGKNVGLHFISYCGLKCFQGMPAAEHPSNTKSTFLWPWANDPKLLGGEINNNLADPTSYGYRVIYRLERHPQWAIDDAALALADSSTYTGTYVLTLTAYRDIDRKGGRLEQLSDPMVVYLRDKKVRRPD